VDGDDRAYLIYQFYGCTGEADEGLKWSADRVFSEVARIEREHPWLKGKRIHGVADPSIWDGSRGIAIIEEAEKQHIWFDPGINARIPGWMQIHERLKFSDKGEAKLYIFNNCKDSIRVIPLMMFDEHKVEDLDTDLEDHILDSIRYFAMSRPIASRVFKEDKKPMHDPLNQFTETKNRYKTIFRR
jgi:hypothetical protein